MDIEHLYELLEKINPKLVEITKSYLAHINDFNFTGHRTPEKFIYLNILDSILCFINNSKIPISTDNSCSPFTPPTLKLRRACFHLSPFTSYLPSPNSKLLDLGTGGGFPGVPLAILFPDSEFTLVDSVEKKLNLINQICKENKISNIQTVHDRIENIGQDKKYREQFDYVLNKALAKPATMLEYSLPMLKIGGLLFTWQSKDGIVEIENIQKVIELLGGKFVENVEYDLGEYGKRFITIIEKLKNTPSKYPREVGIPKLKVLEEY